MDSRQLALLQLCFDEAELSSTVDEDFDPTAFVAEKVGQQVPLTTLVADLKTYGADIDTRVSQIVHDDVHEAFIAISGQLVATEDQMLKVVGPLDEMNRRIQRDKEMIADRRRCIDQLVARAIAQEQSRKFFSSALELLLIRNSLRKLMENCCLTETTTSSNGDATASDQTSSTAAGTMPRAFVQAVSALQRAGVEVQQMEIAASGLVVPESLPSETEVSTFSSMRETYLQEVKSDVASFGNLLDRWFLHLCRGYISSSGKKSADGSFVVQLLDIYMRLGEEQRCLAAFREILVRPLIEETISWKNAAAARQSEEAVEGIFRALCSRLEESVLCVLPLFRKSFRNSTNALSDAVWPAVSDTILKRMLFLFQPGIPNTFHRNFKAAHEVIRLLESKCESTDELRALRSSADMSIWVKKWNVDVYHTLRQNELQNRVDAIVKKPLSRRAAGGLMFSFEEFASLYTAIQDYFSPSIVLYPLVPRFVRDVMSAVGVVVKHFVELASKAESDSSLALTLIVDLSAFQRLIAKKLPELISAALENSGTVPVEKIVFLVEDICIQGVASIDGALSAHLVDQCLASLSNLRSIKAAYSMTRKPMPTSPSWFMPNVFDPISKFRKEATENKLPDATLHRTIHRVLDTLTGKLHALTKEVIISARKAQESLEKLRRKKEGPHTPLQPAPTGGRPSPSELTDRDKMIVQLFLDVKEYGSQLKRFGIQGESYDPLKAVLKLVRRANWILGEDISEPTEVEEDE